MIENFEGATILDEYTCNEATSRLNTLKRFSKKKKSDVDEIIESMISEQNYRGINEFLFTYAESKDQLAIKKYNEYHYKICYSLKNNFQYVGDIVNNKLYKDSYERLEHGLKILTEARCEFKDNLKEE